MNRLRDQVDTMTATEKIDLIEAAWESLESDFPPLSKEQQLELDARWARYIQNPEDVIPWDRVKAELFKNR
jgi:putative addiction module component (TIGR02574 family)